MAFYVNGEILSSSLIEAEIRQLRPAYEQAFEKQPVEQREKQLAEWARENLIEAILFRQQARKEFPDIPDSQIDQNLDRLLQQESPNGTLHQRMNAGQEEQARLRQDIADEIRRELLTRQLADRLPQPSEKAVRSHYQKNIEQYTVPELVHAAHIIKHAAPPSDAPSPKEQIDAVYQQLLDGASFEQLASQHSDCPENAGSLGFFPRGRMVQEFEDVVFSLPEGSYSPPFETQFGWHIAKVIKKQPASVCPLEEVRQVIVRDLMQQAQQTAVESYLDDLRRNALIEEKD
jgi:parvulin-like peptidyl-prolyl isomerase